jgi:hypothetical protein
MTSFTSLSDGVKILLLLLGIGILVFIYGRVSKEGFMNISNPMFCDIDHPCPGHLKCINAQCASTMPREIKEANPVELLPPGAPAPYF